MTPITQTILGDDGNCMAACVASILNLRLEDVPDLMAIYKAGESWWNALVEFCSAKGLSPRVKYAPCAPPKGYSIIGGTSPGGTKGGHACVAFDGLIVHDPHPDKTGLTKIEDYIWFADRKEQSDD